jgi:hypothetical protein
MNWFWRMAGLSENRLDFLEKKYDRIVPRRTIWIIGNDVDPTATGQFTSWLVKLHAGGPGSRGYFALTQASIEWAKDILETFMKYKNSPHFTGSKDVNQYKSLDELENFLREPMELSKQERARQNAQAGQQVLYQDSKYKVIAVTTSEAATQYCQNTAICLKDPSLFKQYNVRPDRPVYIILKVVRVPAIGNSLTEPQSEPCAVLYPHTGEFNCMDNNSVFDNGVGEEMVGLMWKVPNGRQMLQKYLGNLLVMCENPRHYKKLGNTLDKAINMIGASPEQWKQYEGIVGAYPPGYDEWTQTRQPTPIPQPLPPNGEGPAVLPQDVW